MFLIPDQIADLIGDRERDRWEILFDQGEVVFEPEIESVKTRNFVLLLEISARWNDEGLAPEGYLSVLATIFVFPCGGGKLLSLLSVESEPMLTTPDDAYQAAIESWPALRDRLQFSIDAIKELNNA